jgi:hypothetical protein
MTDSQKFTINIEETRRNGESIWDLPPWGHPISAGVMPVLISWENRLFPIGTAFTIAKGISLAATAHHVIDEAISRHRHADRLRRMERLPQNYHLDDVGIYLLHQVLDDSGDRIDFALWPIEHYSAAMPTDVGLCSLKFAPGIPMLIPPLSFGVPAQGERIRCVGYTDFKYPEGGIPLDEVRSGSFDWLRDYGHRLVVVEGFVRQAFSKEFATSYLSGPSFAMSSEIFPAQSGGPAFNSKGYVCGVNSASATSFFNEPASLISLLFPLLGTDVTFGAELGAMRMKVTKPFLEIVGQGGTTTDGTEELIHFSEEDGELRVGPLVASENVASTHETFSHFQDGVESGREDGSVWVLRKNTPGRGE